MTALDLAAIREREKKATPGPWRTYYEAFRPQLSSARAIEVQGPASEIAICSWSGFDNCFRPKKQHLANARFIAHARTDIPALLSELDRLTAEREADKEELEAYRSSVLYDAMMEGAKHKGWNRSSLDRALRITERRLHAARTKEEKND